MRMTRITIKGSSGYGPGDQAYEDRISMTPHSIEYLYKPYKESKTNAIRKWSYRTNSPDFTLIYKQVEEMLPRYLDLDEILFCTDLGITEIIVTYENKNRRKENWCVPSEYFKDLFALIKKLVPKCESIPDVLRTNDDFEESEDL